MDRCTADIGRMTSPDRRSHRHARPVRRADRHNVARRRARSEAMAPRCRQECGTTPAPRAKPSLKQVVPLPGSSRIRMIGAPWNHARSRRRLPASEAGRHQGHSHGTRDRADDSRATPRGGTCTVCHDHGLASAAATCGWPRRGVDPSAVGDDRSAFNLKISITPMCQPCRLLRSPASGSVNVQVKTVVVRFVCCNPRPTNPLDRLERDRESSIVRTIPVVGPATV